MSTYLTENGQLLLGDDIPPERVGEIIKDHASRRPVQTRDIEALGLKIDRMCDLLEQVLTACKD